MRVYLAGAISGNLNPAWKRMAGGAEISEAAFVEALNDANFLGGNEWAQVGLRLPKKK